MKKHLLTGFVYPTRRAATEPSAARFKDRAFKKLAVYCLMLALISGAALPVPSPFGGAMLPAELSVVAPVAANGVYYNFSAGSLSLNLSPATANMITTNDDWSNVASVEGYYGRNLTNTHGVDPQTVLGAEFTNAALPAATRQVNADKGNPSAYNAGGITEFDRDDTYFAFGFQGNVQANPYMVFYLNTVGRANVTVSYDVIDIDSGSNNSVSPVALQYRIGQTGNFTNLPSGFVADATDGPNLHGRKTSKSVQLPPVCNNKPQVQVRLITTNAAGTDGNSTPDEWIGVNNIVIGADPTTAASVAVGGRVFAPSGRGLANASVVLFDAAGNSRAARTNAFGYYRFDALAAGETYVLEVRSKRYVFAEPTRAVSAGEDLSDVDFRAAAPPDFAAGARY